MEELQAEMAEMKKLNFELAQCIQAQEHVNAPVNPEIQQSKKNK